MATFWLLVLTTWQYPKGPPQDGWAVFGVMAALVFCVAWDLLALATIGRLLDPPKRPAPVNGSPTPTPTEDH